MTETEWYDVVLKSEEREALATFFHDGYSLKVDNKRFNYSVRNGFEFRIPGGDDPALRFTLETRSGRQVAKFTLSKVRGNCGMIVSSGCYIQTPFRGKGLGTYLNRMRLLLCKDAGYTVVMCTVKLSNLIQSRLLKRNGWRQVNTFKNKRTGNNIGVYHRNLRTVS